MLWVGTPSVHRYPLVFNLGHSQNSPESRYRLIYLSAIAKGMFPPPPSLFSPDEGVTNDPEGKIYWIVKHGIRLTGMPGFQASLSDTELWQVSLLLLKAQQLSAPVRQSLHTALTDAEGTLGKGV